MDILCCVLLLLLFLEKKKNSRNVLFKQVLIIEFLIRASPVKRKSIVFELKRRIKTEYTAALFRVNTISEKARVFWYMRAPSI